MSFKVDSLEDKWILPPMEWWLIHGSSLPMLQSIAFKLLGQPCSSSCCERNWSTYDFIHSLRRNKIAPKHAEDLVYVHTNLWLLSRNKEEYGKGKSKKWDIGGDTWDEPFGGAGLLSIASLSLDEPELEVVLFDNSDGGHDGDNDEEDDIVITGSSWRLFFYLNLMFI